MTTSSTPMTGAEHFRQAEEYAFFSARMPDEPSSPLAIWYQRQAQVHATLAQAAMQGNPVAYAKSSPAEQPPPGEGLSTGALRESLIYAMDRSGAFGANLSDTKDVVIRAGEQYWSLATVSVGVRAGRFVLTLDATTEPKGQGAP
jgi:hypothetical protein